MSTYFDSNIDHAWKVVLGMFDLFEMVAKYVGEKLGWVYNEKEGRVARTYLEYVYRL